MFVYVYIYIPVMWVNAYVSSEMDGKKLNKEWKGIQTEKEHLYKNILYTSTNTHTLMFILYTRRKYVRDECNFEFEVEWKYLFWVSLRANKNNV